MTREPKVGFYGARSVNRNRIDGIGWMLLVAFGVAASVLSFLGFTFAVYFSVRFLQWLGAL